MFKKITLSTIIAFAITILWCTQLWKAIQIGDTVTLTYSANFEDWSVFEPQKSLSITVWSWNTIKGIESWIIWLKIWDEKTILIKPEAGYAKDYDISKVQKITKMIFDRIWIMPKIWKFYKIWELEGIIKSTEGNWDFQIFMLDTNPKNTYENLILKLKIEKITNQ